MREIAADGCKKVARNLSAVLDSLERGQEEIMLVRNRRQIARLVPEAPRQDASATQSRSGPSATKLRETRSGASRASQSRTVVNIPLRHVTPCKPPARISRATRFRLTCVPRAPSSARILGTPYVPADQR